MKKLILIIGVIAGLNLFAEESAFNEKMSACLNRVQDLMGKGDICPIQNSAFQLKLNEYKKNRTKDNLDAASAAADVADQCQSRAKHLCVDLFN